MDTQRFSRIANGLKSASISSVTQTADALRREGKEVLVFSIGRPDFDTPEHIKAAANDALAKGFVHYTHNRGILPMREAVAAYLKRQNGLDYDPKTEIMITAGAQEALMLCTHALLDPGDEVLVPSPGFLLYYSSIPMLHAVPVPYVLKEPDYDWDGAPVSDRTKLMIFNNPNNPTGKVFSAEEMRDAADFVKKHDLLAISDEAYDRLLYGDAKHRSLAAEPDMRERTLLVGSLSKTYSMTGWRLGYVAGAPELIERLARLQQNYMLSVTSFAQYGGAEALNGPQECVETMRKAFEERRKVLIEGLTGAPNMDAPAMTSEAEVSAAKPCTGSSLKILCPMVLTIFQPPMAVPSAIKAAQRHLTQRGTAIVSISLKMKRARVITPIVFWASFIPWLVAMNAAEST